MFRRIIALLMLVTLCCFSLSAVAEETEKTSELVIEKLQDASDEELAEALLKIENEMRSRMKTSIALDASEMKLVKGGKSKLVPEILELPEDQTAGAFEWSSSDEAVAKVDTKGVVTAVAPGEAKIVCTSLLSSGFDIQAECTVTVYIPVARIAVKQNSVKLTRGTKIMLEPVVTPEDATDKTILFESSDPEIASVTDDGTVTGNGTGTCDITVSAQDGSEKKVSVMFTVVQEVQAITLDTTEGTVVTGKNLPLKGTVEPETAANRKLAWSSADETVATVNQTGTVTGKKAGQTVITAMATDGTEIAATAVVTVIQPMKKITVQDPKIVLAEDISWKQLAAVEPEDTSDQGILWTSSDETIATVDENGTITGKGTGKCVITGMAVDGYGAAVKVNVEVKAFDYVLTTPEEIDVEFETETDTSIAMGFTNRGAFRRKTERETDFGKNGCVKSENPKKIIPVKAGEDTITVTWKTNGRVTKKETYSVYVAQSAIK